MTGLLSAIRFFLELSLLGALGYWGFTLDYSWPVRILSGLGAPLAAAAVWGLLVAPRAPNQLDDPLRFGLEVILFAVGGLALYLADRPALGVLLFVLFLIDRVALMSVGEA